MSLRPVSCRTSSCMACEEIFAYDEGGEWFVVYSLLRPNTSGAG